MWHFIITLQTDRKDISLLNIAVQTAQLFAPEYQIYGFPCNIPL